MAAAADLERDEDAPQLVASVYGEVIFIVPVWQAVALQPAATAVIMAASPLELRRRTEAPDDVSVVVPEGATCQKLPFEALQAA